MWRGQHPNLNSWRVFSEDIYHSTAFPDLLRSPADLLLLAVFFALAISASCTFLNLLRRTTSFIMPTSHRLRRFLISLCGGTFLAMVIGGLHFIVQDTITSSPVDFLHTSLAPWDSGRLSLLLSLSILVIGAGLVSVYALVLTTSVTTPIRPLGDFYLGHATAWMLPTLGYLILSGTSLVPHLSFPVGIITISFLSNRIVSTYQAGSQTSRILTIFTATVAPTLLFYPSLWAHSHDIKKEFVQADYSEQASNYPTYLQNELALALSDIDVVASRAVVFLVYLNNPAENSGRQCYLDVAACRVCVYDAISVSGGVVRSLCGNSVAHPGVAV